MIQRSRELVFVKGKHSRLTVTPTRVTVKVSEAHEHLTCALFTTGLKIAEQISPDSRSMRGEFDVKTQRIKMTTNRGHKSTYTVLMFTFDGELA